jgi:hypothetical protein
MDEDMRTSESSSVNPYHYGDARIRQCVNRTFDVEVKAVLATGVNLIFRHVLSGFCPGRIRNDPQHLAAEDIPRDKTLH